MVLLRWFGGGSPDEKFLIIIYTELSDLTPTIPEAHPNGARLLMIIFRFKRI